MTDDRRLQRDVDAVLRGSRALVGVAARSLDLPDDVTLAQFRALVVLAGHGPQPVGALAAELAVHASTATRLVDRLVAKDLVERVAAEPGDDRRQSHVALAHAGAALIAHVSRRRRRELRTILARLSGERAEVVAAMTVFADVAGEAAESSWELGWQAD